MEEGRNVIDAEEAGGGRRKRRGDGGVYLVAADESDEFHVALRYAARRAQVNRAHVGILHVTVVDDFVHWGTIEARMLRELRQQAEKFVWDVARKVNELNGLLPVIYLREGTRTEAIIDVINEDMNIKMLVLTGGTQGSGPGPLVSYFTGKGLGRLRVPVTVVPGYLEPQKIDSVAL